MGTSKQPRDLRGLWPGQGCKEASEGYTLAQLGKPRFPAHQSQDHSDQGHLPTHVAGLHTARLSWWGPPGAGLIGDKQPPLFCRQQGSREQLTWLGRPKNSLLLESSTLQLLLKPESEQGTGLGTSVPAFANSRRSLPSHALLSTQCHQHQTAPCCRSAP